MDEESEFGGCGDELPYYPPVGSPEWERRLQKASADLMDAWAEIHGHCAAINEGVTKIFRELEQP